MRGYLIAAEVQAGVVGEGFVMGERHGLSTQNLIQFTVVVNFDNESRGCVQGGFGHFEVGALTRYVDVRAEVDAAPFGVPPPAHPHAIHLMGRYAGGDVLVFGTYEANANDFVPVVGIECANVIDAGTIEGNGCRYFGGADNDAYFAFWVGFVFTCFDDHPIGIGH